MSQVTKRALEQSLKNLLLKKPLTKITINDIAEDCGINRMTFYYHFKDIYDLVEWSCLEDAKSALAFTGGWYKLVLAAAVIALAGAAMVGFLGTRLGLSIRATGDNPDMVRSSSINPAFTTIIGLCVANSFTALSGCLLAQAQKSVNIDIGGGMVTIALASLLIGNVFLGKKKMPLRIVGMVLGAFVFRLVYTIALRFNMPAFMLKLVSSVIVVAAISIPYIKQQLPLIKRRLESRKREGNANA